MLTDESAIKELIAEAIRENKIQFMELPEGIVNGKPEPYAVVIVAAGGQGRVAKGIFQRMIREMNARGAGLIIPGLSDN